MKKIDFDATIEKFFDSVDHVLYRRSCRAVNDDHIGKINSNRARLWLFASKAKDFDVTKQGRAYVCKCDGKEFSFTKYGFLPYVERNGFLYMDEQAVEQYDTFMRFIEVLPRYYRKKANNMICVCEQDEILTLYRNWKFLNGRQNVVREFLYSVPTPEFFAEKVKKTKTR